MAKANTYLKRVFGMELIALSPRDLGDGASAEAAASSKKSKTKKKKKGNAAAQGEDEESSASDEASAPTTKKKRSVAAKFFALRSILPSEVIEKAILPMPDVDANHPNNTDRFMEDVQAELGSAGMNRDELKDWKIGRDEILDWRTGPEQRTLMGVLNVILALIMVNERVLTDGESMLAVAGRGR